VNHLHITFTTLQLHRTLLILSAPQAEGDAEEGSSFAWAGALTLSGIGEEVLRGRCCCIAEEMDTRKLIVGERSERSANLIRGEMEGT
jgi:hypothetical protein